MEDPPDFLDSELVCKEPLQVPTAQSKMNLVFQNVPMCPFGKAVYMCNAGGINVFKVIVVYG